jgi:hypothetical protein
MGLQFNVPGSATYPGSDSYQVQFRCDQSYNLRNVLEANTISTFNDATSTGSYDTPSAGSIITMQLIDKQLNPILTYNLIGAYVVNIGDVAYDIKDTGSIVTFPVTLAYQFWRKTINQSSVRTINAGVV